MDGYSISQVAERTGFPPSTLRFYDQSGLVRPGRTLAGYRSYDDDQIERLRFIGRAKGFGLSLEEITDLVALLDEERCAPVQARLLGLIDGRIDDAQHHIAELVAFTGELRRVAESLHRHTPDGPCDDACGCTADATVPVRAQGSRADEPGDTTAVALVPKPARTDDHPAIACTLAPDEVRGRVEDWQAALATATERRRLPHGVRLGFPAEVDVAALAALAAAEQACCCFFTFTLTIDGTGVALDVVAPDEARPVVDALIGVAP